MSNASIHPLHDAILSRFHNTISRFPPVHAPTAASAVGQPYRVGEYLVQLGYLRPRELAAALRTRPIEVSQHILPLGCLLVAHSVVAAPVLSTVLLLQYLDRLEHMPALPPRFLGEQLLVDAALTPDQLALVLQEQIQNCQHGVWTRLGDLIIGHGWLDSQAITAVVQRLRRETLL
jgi:hypothetical protein